MNRPQAYLVPSDRENDNGAAALAWLEEQVARFGVGCVVELFNAVC